MSLFWGIEDLIGVWLGVLIGVVFKEGVTGIGLRGGCWIICKEFCEEEIRSVETEEKIRELESVESDKKTVRSRMETKRRVLNTIESGKDWTKIGTLFCTVSIVMNFEHKFEMISVFF